MFVVGPAGSSRANCWFVIIQREQMIHTNTLPFMKKTYGVNKVASSKKKKKVYEEEMKLTRVLSEVLGWDGRHVNMRLLLTYIWKQDGNKKKKTQTHSSGVAADTVIEVGQAANEGTEVTLGGRDEGDYLLWRRVYTS